MPLSELIAAEQRAAIAAAAERALLAGEGTAATAGPGLVDLAAEHERATRIDRYLDRVEAHAPAEIARLGAIYGATKDRAVLRRLIVLQGCAEAVSDARAVLADEVLLTDLIAAQTGGPITAAMRARGLVAADRSGEGLSSRAHSVLRLIGAALNT